MGFLKNIIDDISEIGTLKSSFAKKVKELSDFYAAYSYGDIRCSEYEARRKASGIYKEMKEISEKFTSKDEKIRIYLDKGVVEYTSKIYLRAMELAHHEICTCGRLYTNAYIEDVFYRAETEV